MVIALYLAAALIVAVGLAHSYLGERYLLRRLFRRADLPKLFGDVAFTKNTLRFAWHITSIAWFGLAAIVVQMAHPPTAPATTGLIVGICFLVQFAIALLGSRGKHLAWIAFLAVGVLVIGATL
jgi:hypothetical protein